MLLGATWIAWEHWLRGGKYLYQSIPGMHLGMRMIDKRWELFRRLLTEAGAGFDGNVVFDIGCNMGMMIHSALAEGARWGVGWDRPNRPWSCLPLSSPHRHVAGAQSRPGLKLPRARSSSSAYVS